MNRGINQVDAEAMQRGIYGLGGFLAASDTRRAWAVLGFWGSALGLLERVVQIFFTIRFIYSV